MTGQEIVQALRCTSTPGSLHEDCTGCPYYRKEKLDAELKEKLGVDTWPSCDVNKVGMDAADLIERLTAENEELRKEIEWKDMIISLAQRKQAKAEAERDALTEQIKERHDCRDCKHNDFCDFDSYTVLDCMHCVPEVCPCAGCFDSSRWEWRGLPEAPEEIKAPFTEDTMINLAAQALGVEPSRLREIAEADKDGRVVVLPCKVGDTVWRIIRDGEPHITRDEVRDMYFADDMTPCVELVGGRVTFTEKFGKTVFLSRAEAERALQEMEGKEEGRDE